MYKVVITDEGIVKYDGFFERLDVVASTTFSSYEGYDVVDVTDVTIYCDNVAEYKFSNEMHKNVFRTYAQDLKKKWST